MREMEEAAPELTPLEEMRESWSTPHAGRRLAAVRAGAQALRARLADAPPVESVHTFEMLSLVYPTRFAFWGAALVPAPYALLEHRVFLVQFRQGGVRKRLLFNPTDPEGLPRAPYFQHLLDRYKRFTWLGYRVHAPLEKQLARVGLRPEDIDYVAFDHFHLQDLRGLLGTHDGRFSGRFPRAWLLAQEREWAEWEPLHPLQQAFYVHEGRQDVREERVVRLRGDVELGEGVVLVRTPGHTAGNQTLFFKTERGVWGVSENGVCADNWSPHASRIPGVAARTREQGLEVLLNNDTPESGADHYASMILERTVVDRVPGASDFVQMFPSFELTPSLLSMGLKPTWRHRGLHLGRLARGEGAASRAGTQGPRPDTREEAHPL